MAKVFISFVQEDNDVAEAVKRLLEKEFESVLNYGDVFLSSDRWILRPGENWMDRIKKELKECSVLVSLLSKRSVERRWIHFEGGAAWISEKLRSVFFGKMTIDAIPRPYSDLIVVDLRKDPYGLIQGVADLLERERLQIKPIPPPPFIVPMPFRQDDERTRDLREKLDLFVDKD